jgi:UDP-glucose 4-epimerase
LNKNLKIIRMKILVTGGAGFIGSQVAEAFLKAGHEVHIVDNMATGKPENIPPAAVFHPFDISGTEVVGLIEQERFEVICHHAAQIDVRKSVADPLFDARVNILASLNLVEHGLRNGLKKIIFASSGGTVYGEQTVFPATEDHPLKPISPYGITKLSFEHYLYYYHTCLGLEYLALRYGNVYGPRQNPHGEAGVVAIFTQKILSGEQPLINGDGKQTRDYVFVEDVVSANVAALNYSGSGSFNVGTGREISVLDIFDAVRDAAGSAMERKHAPAKVGEQSRSVLDYARIHSAMGWKPGTSFEAGILKTVEWFKQKV